MTGEVERRAIWQGIADQKHLRRGDLELLLGSISAGYGADSKAMDLEVLGEQLRGAGIRINQQQTGSGGHKQPSGDQPKAANPSSPKESELNRASK